MVLLLVLINQSASAEEVVSWPAFLLPLANGVKQEILAHTVNTHAQRNSFQFPL